MCRPMAIVRALVGNGLRPARPFGKLGVVRARASVPRQAQHAMSVSNGEGAGSAWDRDEYDVALGDGAAYRIYRDRHEDRWFIEGILD